VATEDAERIQDVAGDVVAGAHGHAVVVRMDDRLALWTVAPGGQRTGAWVEDVGMDPNRAKQLLTLLERRAPVGADRGADAGAAKTLADAAGVTLPTALTNAWLDIFEAIDEVVEIRRELALAAVATKGKPPTYDVDLDGLPRDVTGALGRLQLSNPGLGAEPAASAALATCRLLEAAVQAWQETESARLRRKALHQFGGRAVRPLPPRWLSKLRQAYPVRIDV
jgi:hypothetical protein